MTAVYQARLGFDHLLKQVEIEHRTKLLRSLQRGLLQIEHYEVELWLSMRPLCEEAKTAIIAFYDYLRGYWNYAGKAQLYFDEIARITVAYLDYSPRTRR